MWDASLHLENVQLAFYLASNLGLKSYQDRTPTFKFEENLKLLFDNTIKFELVVAKDQKLRLRLESPSKG